MTRDQVRDVYKWHVEANACPACYSQYRVLSIERDVKGCAVMEYGCSCDMSCEVHIAEDLMTANQQDPHTELALFRQAMFQQVTQ